AVRGGATDRVRCRVSAAGDHPDPCGRGRGAGWVNASGGRLGYVEVRAYAELNHFLAPQARGATGPRPFRPHQTVKDVLEAMGIPHTEIDLILVNGDPADFDHRPTAGDRIAAYPMFEATDVGSPT